MERYYLTGGAGSGIRIDLPKGSYVPTFIRTPRPLPVAAKLDHLAVRQSAVMPVALSAGVLASAGLAIALMVGLGGPSTWTTHPVPTVQINAFVPVDAFSAEMASGLQDEVRRALMGNNHLAVVDVEHALEPTPADFVMEGSVRCVDGWIRVSARLLDTRTQTYVWAHAYDRPVAPEAVLDDQTAIADAIVRQMALPSNS